LQLKSRKHPEPHDVVHAAKVPKKRMSSHVHPCEQITFWLLSSVSFDGVDTRASMVRVEVVEQVGPAAVVSGPRLHPMMLANRVTTKKTDRISCSSLVDYVERRSARQQRIRSQEALALLPSLVRMPPNAPPHVL
jgi:hypothetical protein